MLGFRVQGLGFRLLDFGVWGSRFRVYGEGSRVEGLGFRVEGLVFIIRLRVEGSNPEVGRAIRTPRTFHPALRFGVWGLGFGSQSPYQVTPLTRSRMCDPFTSDPLIKGS
jgi:hypothetical protein